jgi:hypothetical protein
MSADSLIKAGFGEVLGEKSFNFFQDQLKGTTLRYGGVCPKVYNTNRVT